MTAAMDVAYLDAPWVEHVPRREFLLLVSPVCWEDTCWDCGWPGCICACHDEPPLRVLSVGERIMRLADSVGGPR